MNGKRKTVNGEQPAAVKKALRPEVAEKYELLKGHGAGEYHYAGRVVHLDKIGPETADFLAGIGFPYLVEKVNGKRGTVNGAEPGENA